MFIEMDNMFINLDNITNIVKFDERFIRIYFFAGGDFIDIEEENEEELNKTWEWLKETCLGREVSKNGK